MMGERPQLIVEGNDDLYTIANLLVENNVFKRGTKPKNQPIEILAKNGVDELLLAAVENADTQKGKPTGFVLDIDNDFAARWRQVSEKILTPLGIDPPPLCPEEGFIAESPVTRSSIGVWLMPDNRTAPGALEHLLLDLVPPASPLWSFASECTLASEKHGAAFPAQSDLKARLHCLLAWQESPGEPYGKAIEFNYLGHDSPRVTAFVAWFRSLYSL